MVRSLIYFFKIQIMQESTFEDVFIVNKTESNFQALETFLKLDTEEEEIELSEIEANILQVNEVLSSKILKVETFNVDLLRPYFAMFYPF